MLRSSLVALLALAAATPLACSDEANSGPVPQDAGLAPDTAPAADGHVGPSDQDRPLIPASRVDLLLVVDNSASMSDKAALLANSLGTLIRDIAKAVNDVHLGVLTTSLGTMGGDVCQEQSNERAHLRKTDSNGTPVPGFETGVLAYTGTDVEGFVKSAQTLVRGIREGGCGFEAQLETTYRFLVQPDPWASVKLDSNARALLEGIDEQVLLERKAFLRPDSALVVLMLTDEDDSSADPLSMGGQGYAFAAKSFPGSKVARRGAQGTTAARATTPCATNPADPNCTSCGFQELCNPDDPVCERIKNDPNCRTSGTPGQSGPGFDGYYAAGDDEFNVRFHRMKQRYGIDPQFPIARYVDGFTSSVVPDRSTEHPSSVDPGGRRLIAEYVGTPHCTNPIFAAELPTSANAELCALERGTRSRELVVFTLLGGVPEQFVGEVPNWGAILGAAPQTYDETGIDPHMVQSVSPRPGLAAPSETLGDNGKDPIHGREWDTKKGDLQYACTFELPAPKACNASDVSCDCMPNSQWNPPLCSPTPGIQVRAKAYPSVRPLRFVRDLGSRGVVGSICSKSYDFTMTALVTRLASRLAR